MAVLAVMEGSAFAAGVAMGTASIMSVGPNNLLLVREGLVRGRVGLVASTVWASYIVLLVSAFVLADKLADKGSLLRPVLSWLGLVALAYFAWLSLRAYARSSSKPSRFTINKESTSACIGRTLAIVWLNPLTYVELLFIPASIDGNFILQICRVLFIFGLVLTSTIACYGYSFGGGLCASVLKRKDMLRLFDLSSGILLSCLTLIMAVGLVLRPN